MARDHIRTLEPNVTEVLTAMSLDPVWLLLGGIALSALAGSAFEHRRLKVTISGLEERLERLSQHRTESHRSIAKLKSTLTETQTDKKTLTSFLVTLPEVFAQINGPVPRRDIPALLASTLEHLFEARTVLVYLAKNTEELVLAHSRGLDRSDEEPHRIRFGEGVIGAAANRQLTLTQDNLMDESANRRASLNTEVLPGVKVDMVAPMVQHGQTLGVLVVSGPERSHYDEEKMVKLVADLGALALRNNELLAKFESIANAD